MTALNAKPVIINATQHQPTDEQIQAGVIATVDVVEFLNFTDIPSIAELEYKASIIATTVQEMHQHLCEVNLLDPSYEKCHCMIGGAPYLMAYLELELVKRGINPVYAFSQRQSVEEHQADGSVRKLNVFKHMGFVGL